MSCSTTFSRTVRKAVSGLSVSAMSLQLAAGSLAFTAFAPLALAVAPTCNGLTATIYVDGGLIVSTVPSDNGDPYTAGTTTLTGSSGDDVIVGTASGDKINGSGGNDTICALEGNNSNVRGGSGNDTIFSGSGDDTVDGEGDNDVITDDGGTNDLQGGSGNDTITAGSGDDTIDGEGNNDIINAGEGNNDVQGGSGDDTINTGSGNDTIDGEGDDDVITDLGGTNDIQGGSGEDTIVTGAGNDTINAEGNDDICSAGAGSNVVTNCEFGYVTIVKDAVPNDAQDFEFTGGLGGFFLDDDANGTLSNTRLFTVAFGVYAVTEVAVSGWTLSGIVCADPNSNTTTLGSTATINLDAANGDAVTCTFTNTQSSVATTTTLLSSLNPSTYNTNVTFTATVSGGATPTGTVDLKDGATVIATGALVAGVATFNISNLSVGSHSLTAVYGGDGSHTGSTSTPALSQVVNQAPTTTVLGSSLNPSMDTDTVTFTATVSGETPTGTVTFKDNGTTLGTTALTAGVATFDASSLLGNGASHPITAEYNGDTNNAVSTSNTVNQVVNTLPTLKVVKMLPNDNGGTLTISEVDLFVTDSSLVATQVYSDDVNTFAVGDYTVTEVNPDPVGYVESITAGDCASDGTISLALNQHKMCVFTNDDLAATLTVITNVTNDNGGTLLASGTTMTVTGNSPSPSSFTGDDITGTDVTINAGSYEVTGSAVFGYDITYSADCPLGSDILPGRTKTCTVTYDDIQPLFTVNSLIINDNGGTLTDADFPPFFDGSPVTYGVQFGIDASPVAYVVSELAQPSIYAYSFSGDCDASGNVTLSVGDVKQCTITNNDIAPKLTIIKQVINDNNGSATENDFVLTASGMILSHGVATDLNVGGYKVGEFADAAYDGTFSGDCDITNGFIHLGLGEVKTCTITNNDRSGFFFADSGVGGGASIQGNGGHRGNGTNQFAAKANFVAGFFGAGGTAPGAFGGGADVPLSQDEISYICSMQKAIPVDALDSFVEWFAAHIASIMGRDANMIASALKDPAFCAPKQAAAPVKKADVIVHLNSKGVVVSTNPVWNACVSGQDLTLDLIKSNEDTYVHRQGTISKEFAMTCRDYHRGDVSMWQHPDYPGLEIQLDTKGRLVGGLPTGFVAKKDLTNANVATK